MVATHESAARAFTPIDVLTRATPPRRLRPLLVSLDLVAAAIAWFAATLLAGTFVTIGHDVALRALATGCGSSPT